MPGMAIEAAILDRDDGVLQVGRDLVERDVVPLLVEAEPRLAVGAVEHRVADAARQPMDGDRVARQPDARHRAADDQRDHERERDPVGRSGAAAAGSAASPRRFGLASPCSMRVASNATREDHDDQAEREPLRDLEVDVALGVQVLDQQLDADPAR